MTTIATTTTTAARRIARLSRALAESTRPARYALGYSARSFGWIVGDAARAIVARQAEIAAAAWYRLTGTGYGAAIGAGTVVNQAPAVSLVKTSLVSLRKSYVPDTFRLTYGQPVKAPTTKPGRWVPRLACLMATGYVALGVGATVAMVMAGSAVAVAAVPVVLGVLSAAVLLGAGGLFLNRAESR